MKSSPKVLTRVGKIRYTNCLPFYHRLNETSDFEFFETYPVEVNQALAQGKVEIAPVSSLEYLKNQSQYLLLPGMSIASRDFAGSVLLLSCKKIEDLNGAKIALSQESLSSAALLQILLKSKLKFENSFETVPSDPEKMTAEYEAALVIGDDALFYQPREFVYKYDLAELWWNWAGKPFCFALWAVRKKFAEQFPEEVAFFWQRLKKNTEANLTDIETLIKDAAGLTFLDDKFPKVFGYLFNLNYGLDPETLGGLELFYRLAHRLGVAPKPAKPEFLNLDA